MLAHRKYLIIFNYKAKSPSLIQPMRRKKRPNAQVSTPGKIKQINTRPSQLKAVGAIALAPWVIAASLGEYQPLTTPICPTNPQVPIPELTAGPFISSLKRQVESGPVITEARIGGSHTLGFLMMFGI